MNLHCRRLDSHDAHDWTVPGSIIRASRAYSCPGRIQVALVERPEMREDHEQDELAEWYRGAEL